MAAKRKYRKAPGAKASLDTLKNYEAHIKEVDKHNAGLEAEKKAKKATRERIKKAKAKR
jgi:ribosome maturation factor RimP